MRSAKAGAFALMTVIFSAIGAFADNPVVGAEAIPNLPTARSQAEASDALEKRLPDVGGRLLLVSPHDYLTGLLLPLRREGVLKELTVVLPFDNSLTQGHLEEMRSFLEKAGVTGEDRKTFTLDNGSITGRIEGMVVAVHAMTGLPRQDRSSLVVIDTAFLPAVYRNEVKMPMVDLAWKLVLTLKDRGMASAGSVVIFDATGRSDFPLEFGYLAALIKEMVSSPGDFAASLPGKWKILKSADGAYFFSQYAEGMSLYREYLRLAPGDASVCYRIAASAIRDLDVDMALHWLGKAVEADPVYKRAFAGVAEYLDRKELHDAAERVLLAGLAKFPKDLALSTNLSALYLSRGEAARKAGDTEGAREYFSLAAGVDGAESQLRDRARSLAGPPPARNTSPN